MAWVAPSLENLIQEFMKFPSIGRKSAERMAFHLLRAERKDAEALAQAMLEVKDKILNCSQCFSLSEQEPCSLCADPNRDQTIICIVENPLDIVAFEKAGGYRGLYHVLGGCLSPLGGITADDLNIDALMRRLEALPVGEAILAMNPSVEGEATALYMARLLKARGLKVSRIGLGLPMGSSLEYADSNTLKKALEGRRGMET